METRLKLFDKKVKSSLLSGPLYNFHLIDSSINKVHRFGGLAILCFDVLTFEILQSNKVLIDLYITSSNINFSGHATGIYG
jgi:hypothetical protein